jgi:hypothetical protein
MSVIKRHLWSTAQAWLVAFLLGVSGPLLTAVRAQDQSPGIATSPDGKVRVQVLSLKRTEGETVTLRFQVTNNSNDDFRVVPINLRLIDIAGRRIYSPGVTSNNCITPVGQQLTCYAVFGAPPPSTKTMTVQFYEKFDLINGVPIGE